MSDHYVKLVSRLEECAAKAMLIVEALDLPTAVELARQIIALTYCDPAAKPDTFADAYRLAGKNAEMYRSRCAELEAALKYVAANGGIASRLYAREKLAELSQSAPSVPSSSDELKKRSTETHDDVAG